MNLKLYILILITFFSANGQIAQADRGQKPLRALLYCYLPAMNPTSIIQFQRLSLMINSKLKEKDINVIVDTCDSTGKGNSSWLYDPTQINKFFNTYDIIQLDLSYIGKITQKLLLFTQDEIDYYHDVFEFQWEPLKKGDKLSGSPGLLCSNFKETRFDKEYENRLVSEFKASSAYDLMALYMNEYLNVYTDQKIEDFDYCNEVDNRIVAIVANFLKQCQDTNSQFDYSSNWCLKQEPMSFFPSKYSSTIGYSQNLFNFLKNKIKQSEIAIEHMVHGKSKKLFYMDPFIAKQDSNRETVLKFYKFMLSDQILDIYIGGKYTNFPQTTYLLPPTKKYMEKMTHSDSLYDQIYKSSFTNTEPIVIYHPSYVDNLFTYASKIDGALNKYKHSGVNSGRGEL